MPTIEETCFKTGEQLVDAICKVEQKKTDQIYHAINTIIHRNLSVYSNVNFDLTFAFANNYSSADEVVINQTFTNDIYRRIIWEIATNLYSVEMAIRVLNAVQYRLQTELGVWMYYYYPYYNVARVIVNPNYH